MLTNADYWIFKNGDWIACQILKEVTTHFSRQPFAGVLNHLANQGYGEQLLRKAKGDNLERKWLMGFFVRSNKIILADSQALHRDFAAKALAVAEDMRIVAHCQDLEQMYRAIADYPDAIVLFAASLQPDLTRLQILLETTGSRGIAIVEASETAEAYLEMGFSGVVFRSDYGSALVDCVHRIAVGDFWIPPQLVRPKSAKENIVGPNVRDRLTQNEMRLLSRVSVGLCTRLRVGVGEKMRPFGGASESSVSR